MPVAMRAMAQAAKDAGLSQSGTVAEMNDLMKQGKLLSTAVLPHFSKQLRNIANDNDALAKALKENLAPSLGRAKLTLQEFQNAIFTSGLKEATKNILDTFSIFQPELIKLGESTGKIFKALGKTLLISIALPLAKILDMKNEIQDAFGGDRFKPLRAGFSAAQMQATPLQSIPKFINAAVDRLTKQTPEVKINVTPSKELGNVIDAKIEGGQQAMINQAFNSMGTTGSE